MLIRGQGVGEVILEPLLVLVVLREGEAGPVGPFSIESQKTVREVIDPFFDLLFSLAPLLAAKA